MIKQPHTPAIDTANSPAIAVFPAASFGGESVKMSRGRAAAGSVGTGNMPSELRASSCELKARGWSLTELLQLSNVPIPWIAPSGHNGRTRDTVSRADRR